MKNGSPSSYYLQKLEITQKILLTKVTHIPNKVESLQMTMNLNLKGRSSITTNKPLMVFTGTDPEYSVEDYLSAVKANLILNIGPEPINTSSEFDSQLHSTDTNCTRWRRQKMVFRFTHKT